MRKIYFENLPSFGCWLWNKQYVCYPIWRVGCWKSWRSLKKAWDDFKVFPSTFLTKQECPGCYKWKMSCRYHKSKKKMLSTIPCTFSTMLSNAVKSSMANAYNTLHTWRFAQIFFQNGWQEYEAVPFKMQDVEWCTYYIEGGGALLCLRETNFVQVAFDSLNWARSLIFFLFASLCIELHWALNFF